MKSLIFIIIIFLLMGGCAKKDIAIEVRSHDTRDVQEHADVSKEDSVVVQQKRKDSDFVQKKKDSPILQTISTKKTLVSWGHKKAERKKADIDTVIIHSVYSPFTQDPHKLTDVLMIFKDYGVAPHYIIERDGTRYQIVEEKDIAWHAGRSRVPDGRINVNDFSLGVEMINSLENTYTDAQYQSLRALLLDIKSRYDITYILGHDEIEVHDPWNFDWDKINDLRHATR